MRRFISFIVLGPVVGLAIASVLSGKSQITPLQMPRWETLWLIVALAYAVGAIPACLAAVADYAMAPKLPWWERVFWTSFVGYLSTVFIVSLAAPLGAGLMFFGVVGAIPAALGALLSTRDWRRSPGGVGDRRGAG